MRYLVWPGTRLRVKLRAPLSLSLSLSVLSVVPDYGDYGDGASLSLSPGVLCVVLGYGEGSTIYSC